MLTYLILLILFYKCLTLSLVILKERALLAEHNIGVFMIYNYVTSLWLPIMPILALSVPIIHIKLPVFIFFRTVPHTLIAYIPLVFSGMEFSRRLHRKTDSICELNRKIESKAFQIGFLSFAYFALFIVFSLGSLL